MTILNWKVTIILYDIFKKYSKKNLTLSMQASWVFNWFHCLFHDIGLLIVDCSFRVSYLGEEGVREKNFDCTIEPRGYSSLLIKLKIIHRKLFRSLPMWWSRLDSILFRFWSYNIFGLCIMNQIILTLQPKYPQ